MAVLLLVPFVVGLGLTASLAVVRPAVVRPAGPRSTRQARPARLAPVAHSATLLLVGLLLLAAGGTPSLAGGLLRADALSAYLLTLIGAVGLTATWGGLGTRPPRRRYSALICLFLTAMSLAVLTDNLGAMWIAVEATTIATAFLVAQHGGRRALEAAWKYVVLGSVGVAIALLGTVLLYAASRAAGYATLSWTVLTTLPLDPGLVRVATGLAVLGYATKAGLAPMHSWLPDAHSQAPAAVSGLMSGVLLAVAFGAILRVQAVADSVLGASSVRGLLLAAGLGSLLVAALLMLRQRDFKRLLAYSSIEHMGVLAVGAAIGGPVALAAVLLHALGHGLAKAVLFVVSGRILAAEGSTRIADVRGLLARRPAIAVPFAAGLAVLAGFPPFALFFSEVAIVLAGWEAGLGWAVLAALVLLLVVFAGLARAANAMLLGPVPQVPDETRELAAIHGEPTGPMLPLWLALGVTAVAGFAAGPLGGVLARAAAAVAR